MLHAKQFPLFYFYMHISFTQGYCSNGSCELPVCATFSLPFCGVREGNPCKERCEFQGQCSNMVEHQSLQRNHANGNLQRAHFFHVGFRTASLFLEPTSLFQWMPQMIQYAMLSEIQKLGVLLVNAKP